MARRKRASMREGPLADLFRSTASHEGEQPTEQPAPPDSGREAANDEAEDETRVLGDREATAPPPPRAEQEIARSEPEHGPPDPERVRAYRVEERGLPPIREPSERLSRIFADDAHDVEGPAYGREEPGPGDYHGPPRPHLPVIRVVGVGGAGVNAINRMIEAHIPGVEFMAINTDLQSLQQSTADVTVHLGSGVSRGLGTGSNPELGYKAAFEEQDKIKRLLKGSDMVFVTAGVGGGTGTGAAPVVARLARDVGALTVGIVTKPFRFEGTRRAKQDDDDRGLPGGRRRPSPGRSGDLRVDHPARPDQPRLCRRADDYARRRPGPAGDRDGHGRDPRRLCGGARRVVAAARDLGGRRPLDPALDHGR